MSYENTLLLTFNETLDSSQAFNCLNYNINQNIGIPTLSFTFERFFRILQLNIRKPFPITEIISSIAIIDESTQPYGDSGFILLPTALKPSLS
jgi:hypothetical protein